MRIFIATTLAFSIAAAAAAVAQSTGTGSAAKPSTSSAAKAAGAAPVGHRQPTVADVGSDKSALDLSAEDKALDRKIKGICRGC